MLYSTKDKEHSSQRGLLLNKQRERTMKITLGHQFASVPDYETFVEVVTLAHVPGFERFAAKMRSREFTKQEVLEMVAECLREMPLNEEVTGSHEVDVYPYEEGHVTLEANITIVSFYSIAPVIKGVKEQYESTIMIGNAAYVLYVSVMTDGSKKIQLVHHETRFMVWQSP